MTCVCGDCGNSQSGIPVPAAQGYLITANTGVGPPGPKGDKGDPGPAGPEGPAGPAGADGVDGAVGPVGPVGPAGPQGPKGDPGKDSTVPGPAGPVGPAGPKGDKGDTGATGAVGPAGPVGSQGPKGDTGPQGPQGVPGGTGPQGEVGPTGPRGPAGAVGAQGPVGPAGPVGATGPAGPQGEQGIPGPEGPQGQDGLQGPPGLGITFKGTVATWDELPATATQGDLYVVETPVPAHGFVWDEAEQAWIDAGPVQGPQGIEGPVGPQGVQGEPGPAGPQGEVGPVGPEGPQGPAGVDGAQGEVGPEGPMGPAGPQGEPGVQGPAGADSTVPGPEGPAGPVGPQGPEGPQGIQGEQGLQGPAGLGIVFRGEVPTYADLPASAVQGDLWVVADPQPAHGWVWDDATGGFIDAGQVQGPQGIQGPQGVEGPVGPAGPSAVSVDAGNTSRLGTDGLVFTPAAPGYTLPVATASVLGGVKSGSEVTVAADGKLVLVPKAPNIASPISLGEVQIGNNIDVTGAGVISSPVATASKAGVVKVGAGLSVTADGTLSASGGASGNYLLKTGDVMQGHLRFANAGGVSTFDGQNWYLYYDGSQFRITTPQNGQALAIDPSTRKVAFNAVPNSSAPPSADVDLANKKYVDDTVNANKADPKTVTGVSQAYKIWVGSLATYNGLSVKDPGTIYHIL